ncbi:uncharacterized protein [Salminus brasiliensis]|uniref:uncharacterized protein n=1 Tax=Salminus brasiliensis TaxID=930266 RepID=UPI003B832CF8
MASAWILIFSVYNIYPAGAVDIYQKQSFVSAKSGEAVTLHCTLADWLRNEDVFWYKQPLGQMPQEVGIKGNIMDAIISPRFQNSSVKLERTGNSISLTIRNPTKDDEGIYYCGISVMKMITFSNGTFLAVTDHSQLTISVHQTPVLQSASPGDSLSLQCTVLSEIRTAELQVLWFRSAAGRSFPEIIYTHHNSSHQCEISSSKHSCMYNISKSILTDDDAGTYYCAVVSCGTILFGNGTTVAMGTHSSLLVGMGLALGLCVIWNITLCCCCVSWRSGCKHCRGNTSQLVPHDLSNAEGHKFQVICKCI